MGKSCVLIVLGRSITLLWRFTNKMISHQLVLLILYLFFVLRYNNLLLLHVITFGNVVSWLSIASFG